MPNPRPQLVRADAKAPRPLAERGPPNPPGEPLRTAAWVAEHVFQNERPFTAQWVLRHCPRVQLSRYVVRFYESEVRAWLASKRRESA